MKSVYLETTVIGHIAGRLHPNASVLARQQVTRLWWETAKSRYRVVVSDLVLAECGDGDSTAAQERLDLLNDLTAIDTDSEAESLANSLLAGKAVPESEPRDALHIAIAAVNGIDYLATWNFKHILNPTKQRLIESICRDAGVEPPTICTPEQLMVTDDDS